MSKFKNWWNKPYTRGNLVKYTIWGMVLSGAMYGALWLVYLVDKLKRAEKTLKIKRVSNVNEKLINLTDKRET